MLNLFPTNFKKEMSSATYFILSATILSIVCTVLWVVVNFMFGICGLFGDKKKETPPNIFDLVDKMSDDDINDLLAVMTKRVVILNWYDRQHLSYILNRPINDEDWDAIVRLQGEMSDATNDLTREWSENMLADISSRSYEEEPDEKQKTLEDVLFTLSNNQLRMYAGVTSTSNTKAELVEMILQHFHKNMKKVVDRKLERLATLLS